eukprot:gnl/Carplike_NY0171/5735_a7862_209.p1 GENE.gnl/Carplike_NY0171/5735_a7862_209~~gnl/Carplike_NY0171/5735_a7862_209.p1  ORF type:complete len:364 (+),score=65.24 gnl/Carplike_NY0171/5735_a7862_209:47-1093(+)
MSASIHNLKRSDSARKIDDVQDNIEGLERVLAIAGADQMVGKFHTEKKETMLKTRNRIFAMWYLFKELVFHWLIWLLPLLIIVVVSGIIIGLFVPSIRLVSSSSSLTFSVIRNLSRIHAFSSGLVHAEVGAYNMNRAIERREDSFIQLQNSVETMKDVMDVMEHGENGDSSEAFTSLSPGIHASLFSSRCNRVDSSQCNLASYSPFFSVLQDIVDSAEGLLDEENDVTHATHSSLFFPTINNTLTIDGYGGALKLQESVDESFMSKISAVQIIVIVVIVLAVLFTSFVIIFLFNVYLKLTKARDNTLLLLFAIPIKHLPDNDTKCLAAYSQFAYLEIQRKQAADLALI